MEALETFEEQDFHGRIWIKDGTLWPGDVMDIRNRLGWLTAPTIMREHAEDLKAFADEIRRVQFTHILMTAGDQRAASIADGLWGHVTQARPGDYLAIQAYLTPQPETRIRLQEIRMLLRDRLHLATTVAYGPRYLHSTGQLHKG
ncbi:MAG: hypothetical protein HYY95_06030, partial [Candidatus Rokubacteria bacterium]|nr:hypothetical protein [Candidatus Rokubacteria bacterium]